MGKEYVNIIRLVNWIIGFIIIPCTYVLNREVTKQIIVLENWIAGIRSVWMSNEDRNREIERLHQNNPLN